MSKIDNTVKKVKSFIKNNPYQKKKKLWNYYLHVPVKQHVIYKKRNIKYD